VFVFVYIYISTSLSLISPMLTKVRPNIILYEAMSTSFVTQAGDMKRGYFGDLEF
jgi:hypothetical protein